MRSIFFHDVCDGWRWENLADDATLIAGSNRSFASRLEAEDDAAKHGSSADRMLERDALRGTRPSQYGELTSAEHILVVQRGDAECRNVARLLAGKRVTATTASSPHALEHARLVCFDCYVVDCGVRDGGLARFCDGVRALDPRVPIVVYTDEPGAADGPAVLLARANVCLRRPEDASALAHTVDGLLALGRNRAVEARGAGRLAIEQALKERLSATQLHASASLEGRRTLRSVCEAFLQECDVRLLAAEAFLRSGGTRAEFDRAWPALVSEVGNRPYGRDSLPLAQ